MQNIDVRPLKQRMRTEIKEWRSGLSPQDKAHADARITNRLLSLREYEKCQLVLTYVSLPIEVDTTVLIEKALQDGKQVAVPRCVDETRFMEFYRIQSLADLEVRTFGVLEPIPQRCVRIMDFSKSICIVPALAYDRSGYRLGYGAGYYDRFLNTYPGEMIGITYHKNLLSRLWRGYYDVPVHLVVTEKGLCIPAAAKSQRKFRKK